ncbi:hypothetical protein [Flavobacterium sp. NRK1]|uniref:hypothetical protein n=1 Tax=Flavobacterium sp. NRK1 TaxID=2954929 RepID=UPI0020924E18|nr:hypothetical protein [Flavobacterium sp. NRK1]MCO6148974.1 hypothetical protein [Flavobacterium sp. NRK1]
MSTARTYSLEWLDALISVTLNPARQYRKELRAEDIAFLLENVSVESQQVEQELNDKVFALFKDNQVRHLVQKYHTALTHLKEQAMGYLNRAAAAGPDPFRELEERIVSSVSNLLTFIEQRYSHYLSPATEDLPEMPVVQLKPSHDRMKIYCNLSGDQLALMLRAADEAQILKARSMNAVFKAIVPHLATAQRNELSADAIRSKAYSPEEPDRQACISALENMIRKIKDY